MIEKKDYCSQVCGGKCCHVWDKKTSLCKCPKLTDNNTCSIYRERYELGVPYSFVASHQDKQGLKIIKVNCGEIKNILKQKLLPVWIENRCCFKYESLLRDWEYAESGKVRNKIERISREAEEVAKETA